MKKRGSITAIALILALTAGIFTGCGGGAGGAGGGDDSGPVVLRFASDSIEGNIMHELNQQICDEVFEKTEGRVKIDYYPASQLGAYDTVFEELMMGTIDLAQIPIPEAYDGRTAMLVVPGYARSFEEAKALFSNDSYMANTIDGICSELGVKLMGLALEGFENIASVKPVSDPFVPGKDKKTSCRTSPYEVTRLMVEDLGYEAVTVAWAEVPTALQTGIVDAWIGGTLMYHYAYTGDIIKYSYVGNLQQVPYPVVMSQKSYDKLSDPDKKVVEEVISAICQKCIDMAEEAEAQYASKLEDKGVQVIYATSAQAAKQASYLRENTWPKYENILTQEILDGMRKELEGRGYW